MKAPTKRTLDRYGLSLQGWKDLFKSQGGKCAVCQKSKKLVIDHEHVPGWKKMPPRKRRQYIRGLCCIACNHYVLTRYADARLHRQAADYLDRYTEGWRKGGK